MGGEEKKQDVGKSLARRGGTGVHGKKKRINFSLRAPTTGGRPYKDKKWPQDFPNGQ